MKTIALFLIMCLVVCVFAVMNIHGKSLPDAIVSGVRHLSARLGSATKMLYLGVQKISEKCAKFWRWLFPETIANEKAAKRGTCHTDDEKP